MSEEYSDPEIIDLLNEYGDALEQHASTGAGEAPGNTTTTGGQGTAAKAEEINMADLNKTTDPNTKEQDFTDRQFDLADVAAAPAVEEKRSPRVLVGAAVAAIAVVVAGVFAINASSSEVDTSPVADETTEDSAEEDGAEEDGAEEGSADDEAEAAAIGESAPVEDGAGLVESATASAAGVGFSGPGSVLFADGEFISIGAGADGVVTVSRSADGMDWTNTPAVGLPEGALVQSLVQTVEGWATVVEAMPDFQISDSNGDFAESEPTERFFAASPDLVNWEITELPAFEDGENGFTFTSGLAASGDQIAILTSVESSGGADELEILVEAGLVDETDLANVCAREFGDDGFIVLSCDDGEELVRVEPGTEVFFDLEAALTVDVDASVTVVQTGPIDGPFENVELSNGFPTGIVGTDEGFVASIDDFSNGAPTFTSSDGLTWSEVDPFETTTQIGSLATADGRVLAMGQVFSDGGAVVFVSDDLGVTWSESTIPTELFSPFGQVVAGEAGFVAQLDGTPEDFDEFDPFEGVPLEVTKDGFTMSIEFATGIGSLTGPDGVAIHEGVSLDDATNDGAIEGVVRAEGPNDDLIWLDPVTGEDLITFTVEDFETLFEEVESSFESDFPQQNSEFWFSADGETWTLLDGPDVTFGADGFTIVAAVGDDEVLLRDEFFGGGFPEELFAFEEEGRDPTEEEQAAIDEFFNDQADLASWTSIPIG